MAKPLTTKELCKRLGISAMTAMAYRRAGMPFFRATGRSYGYHLIEVLRWWQGQARKEILRGVK